jgi:hypothetical protein
MDIPTATAVTTAAVAILVAILTWRQWFTNRARLKHELFDRRYEVYEKVTAFLAEVLQAGRVPTGREYEFLRETKRAYFVFDCDADVKTLVTDIYQHAVHLHALDAELEALGGNERTGNLEEQREIKDWFQSTLSSMEEKFEKYLRLEH